MPHSETAVLRASATAATNAGKQTRPPLAEDVCPFPIFETHRSFPPLSDSLDVVYDDGRGRHVIATKSIAAGEAVSIEDPIASYLSPYKMKANCCHCFRLDLFTMDT
jgi:hypothetical protein